MLLDEQFVWSKSYTLHMDSLPRDIGPERLNKYKSQRSIHHLHSRFWEVKELGSIVTLINRPQGIQ